jgi:hypothetical protein
VGQVQDDPVELAWLVQELPRVGEERFHPVRHMRGERIAPDQLDRGGVGVHRPDAGVRCARRDGDRERPHSRAQIEDPLPPPDEGGDPVVLPREPRREIGALEVDEEREPILMMRSRESSAARDRPELADP